MAENHSGHVHKRINENFGGSFILSLISETEIILMAELFTKQFASNFTPSVSLNQPMPSVTVVPDNMTQIIFRVTQVRKTLRNLAKNKSLGLGGICPI